ncbi:tetratricopeptide repeat protein [Devosia sp. A8/3-2]|nr:tetratricopeptide repeat protein [Devosia sp. A8/3-2]
MSETSALEAALATNPDDHQARFDSAVVLNAEGKRVEAAEALVAIFKRDRTGTKTARARSCSNF